jgi:hypothetical protein
MRAEQESSPGNARRRLPVKWGAVIFSRMVNVPRRSLSYFIPTIASLLIAGYHSSPGDRGLNDPSAAHAEIAKRNPALNPQRVEFTWKVPRDGHIVAGDDPGGAVWTHERGALRHDA